MSRQDLAERWGVSLKTVDRTLRAQPRQLPSIRLGRSVRIKMTDVERFEDRSRAFGPGR